MNIDEWDGVFLRADLVKILPFSATRGTKRVFLYYKTLHIDLFTTYRSSSYRCFVRGKSTYGCTINFWALELFFYIVYYLSVRT